MEPVCNSGELQLWPWVPDHLSLFSRAVGSCGVSQEGGSALGRVSIAEWSWIGLRVELCDLLFNFRREIGWSLVRGWHFRHAPAFRLLCQAHSNWSILEGLTHFLQTSSPSQHDVSGVHLLTLGFGFCFITTWFTLCLCSTRTKWC